MSSPKTVVHPVTRHVYTQTPEGLVEVTDPTTGHQGLFDADGGWRSGELRHADLQLVGWVGRAGRQRRLDP